jgi:hypothetical protein
VFKILKYRHFESQEEYYWKTITLPEIYPSTNHSEMWIENYVDEVTGNFVRFATKDWDFKTHEFIEKKIIDAYESNGKIYIVDEQYKTYELDEDIEVKVKGKRVFTKDDPYGEEIWEGLNNFPFMVGDRVTIRKKKSKNYNRTGTIIYLEYIDLSNILSNIAEIRLDFDDKIILTNLQNLDKMVSKVKITPEDPYGEEIWESKVNELFETENTYPYQFVTKRKWMKPFVEHVYKFKSRDNITYYVTLSLNTDWGRASIKFTDEYNYKGIMNKIKDRYANLETHDAINVLNTVFKIGKDYYEKFKDQIKEVTTNTMDTKRLNIYKHIFSKYFKGWKMNSYTDKRGEFVLEFKPPTNKNI